MAKKKQLTPKDQFIRNYIKVVKSLKKIPTYSELKLKGISRGKVNYYFGNLKNLEKYAKKHHKDTFEEIKTKQEAVEEKRAQELQNLVSKYIKLAKDIRRFPSMADLKNIGISRGMVRVHFTGLQQLKEFVKKSHSKSVKNVFDIDKLICPKRINETVKNVKKYDRLVVSSITKGPVMRDYLKSTYNYCKRNAARCVLIMTKMQFDEVDHEILDEYLSGNLDIVFSDLKIHKHLHINSVKIDAKVVSPTSGIQRFQRDRSSFIYASPKQTCRPVPSKKEGLPRILMSPGAITVPNYIKDVFNKSKRDVMAENDHLIGAIIVEKDGKYYHSRPTQMGPKNEFIDFGVYYKPDGSYKLVNPEGFVMGDLHSKQKCNKTFETWLSVMRHLKVKKGVLHDGFDCMSLNPHERTKQTMRVALELEESSCLSDELKLLVEDTRKFAEAVDELYIVDSNHDDMLARAFDSGQIWEDSRNAFLGSMLHPYAILHNLRNDYSEKQILKMIEKKTGISETVLKSKYPELNKNKSLLEYATSLYGLDSKKEKINWLSLEDSLIIGGYECGDHGHKGVHGARGSVASSMRSFVKRITGHTHVEEQMNFMVSVGHTTDDPRYARGGLSGWTKSSALVYTSGQHQSIRCINGRYRSWKKAFVPKEHKKLMAQAA